MWGGLRESAREKELPWSNLKSCCLCLGENLPWQICVWEFSLMRLSEVQGSLMSLPSCLQLAHLTALSRLTQELMLKCGRWQEFQKVETWGKCSSWQMRNVSFSSLTQMTNFSPIQCLMWKKTWVYTNWIMVCMCINWSQDRGQRHANVLLIFSMMMKLTVVPKSFKQSAGIYNL